MGGRRRQAAHAKRSLPADVPQVPRQGPRQEEDREVRGPRGGTATQYQDVRRRRLALYPPTRPTTDGPGLRAHQQPAGLCRHGVYFVQIQEEEEGEEAKA